MNKRKTISYQTMLEVSCKKQHIINEISKIEESLIRYEEKCRTKIDRLHENLEWIQKNTIILNYSDVNDPLKEKIENDGFIPIADAVSTTRTKLIEFETKYNIKSTVINHIYHNGSELDRCLLHARLTIDELIQWLTCINIIIACGKSLYEYDSNYYNK